MITINEILLILLLHFIGDYVFQTRWMGNNKSSNNYALLSHITLYTITLSLLNPLWGLVNGFLHGVVDYITSRLGKYLWSNKNEYLFFIVLGLDQLLHMCMLIYTYGIFKGFS